MAHQISFISGKAELAYTGKTPWYGFGTYTETHETAGRMLELASMGWTVETAPLFMRFRDQEAPVPGHVAIRRTDSGTVLGVATDQYHPIQNTQAAETMDAVLTEGGAHVEVAGSLFDGGRCFMLARLPESFEVVAGDAVNLFVLLAWGHDGKHGLALKLTPIRVVCNNTLTQALGAKWSRSADVYIRHTANAKIRLDEARNALGLVRRAAETTAEAYGLLAATKATDPASYFATVFPRPKDTAEAVCSREALERWTGQQDTLLSLYRTGRGAAVPGVAGTLWGAYNAATEWVDHVYPVLKSGDVSRTRQQSVLFGAYAEVKARALSTALELAGA